MRRLIGCIVASIMLVLFAIALYSCFYDLGAREYCAAAALHANHKVLIRFYHEFNRVPCSLSELVDFDRKFQGYEASRLGDRFAGTLMFMDVRVLSGFMGLFIEMKNAPLLSALDTREYLHDSNWIIMSFYMPLAPTQTVLCYTGDSTQPFREKKISTAEFIEQLRKQHIAIPRPVIRLHFKNIIILLAASGAVWLVLRWSFQKPSTQKDATAKDYNP